MSPSTQKTFLSDLCEKLRHAKITDLSEFYSQALALQSVCFLLIVRDKKIRYEELKKVLFSYVFALVE